MNILITGSNGQLGSEIKLIVNELNLTNYIFTDIETLDICNKVDVSSFIANNEIDFVINCAAYTNVDGAETDKINAEKINILGPLVLAETTKERNIPIIHVSTDYVYDSVSQNTPFKETDNTKPQSVYGVTKLQGEKEIQKNSKHIIIRTSWLYSSFGNNFVKSMIKYAEERNSLNIVFDQVGTPTNAADLASAILKITISYTENNASFKSGIYNYSNEGVCSWYDFTKEIVFLTNKSCEILPIETVDYPTPAKRPAYSVMNKTKIKQAYNIEIPHWKESLIKFLQKNK